MWLRLKKSFFRFDKDIYIGSVYIPPEGSSYVYDGIYEEIQQDMLTFPENSEILLVGEYNARTSTCTDFIFSSGGSDGELTKCLPINAATFHQIDELYAENLLARHSMDACHMNSHGRDLIEFCKCVGLLIVNGRVEEDHGIGEFTRVDTTGSSLVDYVISSPGLFKQFRSFQVLIKLPESDNKPLSYSIDCDRIESKRGDHESVSWNTQMKYKWTHADLANIKPALTDDIADKHRQMVKEAMANMCDTNDVARFLDDMLSNTFDRAIGSKSSAKQCKV